jgi:hypothetical protein
LYRLEPKILYSVADGERELEWEVRMGIGVDELLLVSMVSIPLSILYRMMG